MQALLHCKWSVKTLRKTHFGSIRLESQYFDLTIFWTMSIVVCFPVGQNCEFLWAFFFFFFNLVLKWKKFVNYDEIGWRGANVCQLRKLALTNWYSDVQFKNSCSKKRENKGKKRNPRRNYDHVFHSPKIQSPAVGPATFEGYQKRGLLMAIARITGRTTSGGREGDRVYRMEPLAPRICLRRSVNLTPYSIFLRK